MPSILKKSFLILFLVFTNFICVSAFSSSECVSKLKDIAQELMNKNVRNPRVTSFLKSDFDGLEEDLIEVCDAMLIYRKDLGGRVKDVEMVKDDLIAYLRSFVASGIDPTWDINFAVIYNDQNPNFTVTFQNPAGEFRTRSYKLSVKSVGLKFELTVKFEGIFIIGSDFNYYDSIDKEYDLGSGIDLGFFPDTWEDVDVWQTRKIALENNLRGVRPDVLRSVNMFFSLPIIKTFDKRERQTKKRYFGGTLTCCSIKETNSIICMIGLGIGLGGSFTNTGIELSYVFGGKMTPVQESIEL